MNTKLSLSLATKIKAALWKGYAQEYIAITFKVSQTTISRILHGKQWTSAVWPDGSTGAMSPDRIAQMQDERLSLTEPLNPQDQRGLAISYQDEIDRKELISDAIQRIGEDAESDMERELHETMVSTDKVQREAVTSNNNDESIEYDILPWNEVERLASDHPLILQANEEDDKILKTAIGIVFKNIPQKEWKSEKTRRFIKTTYQHLEEKEDASKTNQV